MSIRKLLCGTVVLLAAFTGTSNGAITNGTVYLTSIDSGNGHFAKYDVASNAWTQLNDYDTNAQMAVSASGDLYARNAGTGRIEKYNPGSDTWSDVGLAPVGNFSIGNLEVTNDGRFFLTEGGGSVIHYTDLGGNWQTANIGITHNVMGDYDPTTGQYVIGQFGSDNAYLVDTTTLAPTPFLNGPVGNGEWARFSSIVNNDYFFHYGNVPIHHYDLTNNALAAQNTGFVPAGAFYSSSAADRPGSGLFVASLSGLEFDYYDIAGNSVTNLANYQPIGNHSSLAFVAAQNEVPEPTSLTIYGFLLGLGYFARRRLRR